MFPSRNMMKLPPWFPGQFGVPGSDSPEGIRYVSQGITIYVDKNHPDASDAHDGTDPKYPCLSIQGGINKLQNNGDQIVIMPGSYSESIITPDYVTGPNYVHIVGGVNNGQGVQWSSDDNAASCLDLRAVGWTIENIKFLAPTGAACIELRHTDSGANDIAINTIIRNCHFYGQTTGLYGVESHGCYLMTIENCKFENFHNAGGTAVGLVVTTTPLAIPYRCDIKNSVFQENDNHIDFACNGCLFTGNVLMPGYTYTPTIQLRTNVGGNPGDDNVVCGNTFPGDYSIAGGYIPGAADAWLGNWADDVAEAEVGDNGITIARPT